MDVKIEASWKAALKNEFKQPYFQEIALFLKQEKTAGKTIYPPGVQIFNAFNLTHFDNVKVVITASFSLLLKRPQQVADENNLEQLGQTLRL